MYIDYLVVYNVVYYHAIQKKQVTGSFSWIYAAVASEIPNNHMEYIKTL